MPWVIVKAPVTAIVSECWLCSGHSAKPHVHHTLPAPATSPLLFSRYGKWSWRKSSKLTGITDRGVNKKQPVFLLSSNILFLTHNALSISEKRKLKQMTRKLQKISFKLRRSHENSGPDERCCCSRFLILLQSGTMGWWCPNSGKTWHLQVNMSGTSTKTFLEEHLLWDFNSRQVDNED